MNINELVRMAKQSAPELESVPDEAARGLVQAVFKQIREEIEMTPEGQVKVMMLGQFHVRPGQREVDGQTVAVKRVSFRPARPKEEI